MVIPTYWSRPSHQGWKEEDNVYDHPTPLDQEGTLERTLRSVKTLKDKDFELVLLVCPTHQSIEKDAVEKVNKIVAKVSLDINVYMVSGFQVQHMKNIIRSMHKSEYVDYILDINGYSNVRNLGLFVAYIMDADVLIMIDDDEIFENSDFVERCRKFIGGRLYGAAIDAVAGYYLNEDNEYYDKVNMEPWMTFWDRFGSKAKAFDKIIGSEPRLKHTPFAFGGCMVLHRNLFTTVPFDPKVPRGEDIDYLINAKMFAYNFFLDNQLYVKHLPPPKSHPIWKRVREDIARFLYDRAKIVTQVDKPNMHRVQPEDFDPYPGEFLKDDLEDKIIKTNTILAMDYLSKERDADAKEAINNIYISQYDVKPKHNVFLQYYSFQQDWIRLIKFSRDLADEMRKHILQIVDVGLNLKDLEKDVDIDTSSLVKEIDDLNIFSGVEKDDLDKLLPIFKIKNFDKNEIIFRENENDGKIFFIRKGSVDLLKDTEKGDMVKLTTIGEKEYFGETSFLFNQPHSVTVIAREATQTIVFRREDMDAFVQKDARLGLKLLKLFIYKLSHRMKNMNTAYLTHLIKNSSEYTGKSI